MNLDDLVGMVLEVAMMLANDANSVDMRYRGGYQTALLNLLALARARAEQDAEIERNLRPLATEGH